MAKISAEGIEAPAFKATAPAIRQLAQIQSHIRTSRATTGGVIPIDNTKPQVTEGSEILTVPFTPKSASSTLEVDVTVNYSGSGADEQVFALFNGLSADAVAISYVTSAGVNYMQTTTFKALLPASSVATRNITVRAGNTNGVGITVNGVAPTDRFGGCVVSSLVVKEYLP